VDEGCLMNIDFLSDYGKWERQGADEQQKETESFHKIAMRTWIFKILIYLLMVFLDRVDGNPSPEEGLDTIDSG
jgi:hypothetical protein